MAQPSIQDHIAVSNALCAIKPNSHKDVVQKLWQAIVIEWFPPREGYKFAFKGQVMAKDSAAPDAIVIRQVECVQNQQQDEFAERTILMIRMQAIPTRHRHACWVGEREHLE